jgi:hypothetical protein
LSGRIAGRTMGAQCNVLAFSAVDRNDEDPDWPAEQLWTSGRERTSGICTASRRSRLERRAASRTALSEHWTPANQIRVRAADPLSPGSTETSPGRSRAGTGTTPPARVRGRRNCLGRPRDPQHARDRASTRGRLRASNPHRTFPVFEDHQDRGALSPRACDHGRRGAESVPGRLQPRGARFFACGRERRQARRGPSLARPLPCDTSSARPRESRQSARG